jgi:hypothetical protein
MVHQRKWQSGDGGAGGLGKGATSSGSGTTHQGKGGHGGLAASAVVTVNPVRTPKDRGPYFSTITTA